MTNVGLCPCVAYTEGLVLVFFLCGRLEFGPYIISIASKSNAHKRLRSRDIVSLSVGAIEVIQRQTFKLPLSAKC